MTSSSPATIWKAALGNLELQVSRPVYATWLEGTVGLFSGDGVLTVGTPSPFVAEWLEKRMSSLVETTVAQIVGQPIKVSFQVVTQEGVESSTDPSTLPSLDSSRLNPSGATVSAPYQPNGLNHRYTLDSFIVGESNQLAYAAAMAVTSKPGMEYNPLFIYGGVGLGKTHLLHGIGHLSRNRGMSFLYVSAEAFTNEFIGAIQSKKTHEFRNKYRSVDMLLIDDIQFMRGKETIQESFFHTFNELHNANRQIVIACDRPSSELTPLDGRLRSRFNWGLAADIDVPDQETRKAILYNKAHMRGVLVPDDVIAMISENFTTSIRELEGALNRVCAYSDLTAQKLDVDLAYRTLEHLLTHQIRPLPTPDLVLSEICSIFHISRIALVSKRRDAVLTKARHLATYILRESCHLSFTDIGLLLGNRDRTTMQYSWKKISEALLSDNQLINQVHGIQDNIVA